MKRGLRDTPISQQTLADKRLRANRMKAVQPAPVAIPPKPVELDVVPSLLEHNGHHTCEPTFNIERLGRLLARIMPRPHQQTLRVGLLAWARDQGHQSGDRTVASRLADALGRRIR